MDHEELDRQHKENQKFMKLKKMQEAKNNADLEEMGLETNKLIRRSQEKAGLPLSVPKSK